MRSRRRWGWLSGPFRSPSPITISILPSRYRQLGHDDQSRDRSVAHRAACARLSLVGGMLLLDPRISGEAVTSGLIGRRPVGQVRRAIAANLDWRTAAARGRCRSICRREHLAPHGQRRQHLAPRRSTDRSRRALSLREGKTKLVLRPQMHNLFNHMVGGSHPAAASPIPSAASLVSACSGIFRCVCAVIPAPLYAPQPAASPAHSSASSPAAAIRERQPCVHHVRDGKAKFVTSRSSIASMLTLPSGVTVVIPPGIKVATQTLPAALHRQAVKHRWSRDTGQPARALRLYLAVEGIDARGVGVGDIDGRHVRRHADAVIADRSAIMRVIDQHHRAERNRARRLLAVRSGLAEFGDQICIDIDIRSLGAPSAMPSQTSQSHSPCRSPDRCARSGPARSASRRGPCRRCSDIGAPSGPIAAPLGPPPGVEITSVHPLQQRVTRWAWISTTITEPSAMTTGPSGKTSLRRSLRSRPLCLSCGESCQDQASSRPITLPGRSANGLALSLLRA